MATVRILHPCAACGKATSGNASIERDGFGDGPEVPLCDDCGTHKLPTCEELWQRIAERGECADHG